MRIALLLPLLAACAEPVLAPVERDEPPEVESWLPDAGVGEVTDGPRPTGLDLTHQADMIAPPTAIRLPDETGTTMVEDAPAEPTCSRGTARDDEVRRVILDTFGRHGSDALRVAWCESGPWGTSARNGQYRGLFQMGYYERQTYGHGRCAEAQARAAHRYFVASGRDWSPWSCRP